MHNLDIKIDIATARCVGKQRESQSIGSALRNAAGEGRFLVLDCPVYLTILKIANLEFVMKSLKFNTFDNIQRVDDITFI